MSFIYFVAYQFQNLKINESVLLSLKRNHCQHWACAGIKDTVLYGTKSEHSESDTTK